MLYLLKHTPPTTMAANTINSPTTIPEIAPGDSFFFNVAFIPGAPLFSVVVIAGSVSETAVPLVLTPADCVVLTGFPLVPEEFLVVTDVVFSADEFEGDAGVVLVPDGSVDDSGVVLGPDGSVDDD